MTVRLLARDFDQFLPFGGHLATYCGELKWFLFRRPGVPIRQARRDLIHHLAIKAKPRMRNGHTRRGDWYTGDLDEMERLRQEAAENLQVYKANLEQALERADIVVPDDFIPTREHWMGECAGLYVSQTPQEQFPFLAQVRYPDPRPRARPMPPVYGPHITSGLLPMDCIQNQTRFSGWVRYQAVPPKARGVNNRQRDVGDRAYFKRRSGPLWSKCLDAVNLAETIVVGEKDTVLVSGKVGELANPHFLYMIPQREQLIALVDEIFVDTPKPLRYYDPNNPVNPPPPSRGSPCPAPVPLVGS